MFCLGDGNYDLLSYDMRAGVRFVSGICAAALSLLFSAD